MIEVENRRTERVEFLLVPVAREQVPVWLFKPPRLAQAIAGLIVNLSKGGVQVLTSSQHRLLHDLYTVELMLGEADGVAAFSGEVRRVWTHHYSSFAEASGMVFIDPESPVAEFVQQFQPRQSRQTWVRCMLTPR